MVENRRIGLLSRELRFDPRHAYLRDMFEEAVDQDFL
jgi:hypothetical protein